MEGGFCCAARVKENDDYITMRFCAISTLSQLMVSSHSSCSVPAEKRSKQEVIMKSLAPRVTSNAFDLPTSIGIQPVVREHGPKGDQPHTTTNSKHPTTKAQTTSTEPLDQRIPFDVKVRCVLDDICATPTYELPRYGWKLNGLVALVVKWYAPQVYAVAMPRGK